MDKYYYYQNAVQCVEAEIDFVENTYQTLRGKAAIELREDFCGTAQTACEWVSRNPERKAWGIDLDPVVLQWGEDNNIASMDQGAQDRIELVSSDVMEVDLIKMDVILAMNFSYFIFMQRDLMIQYFKSVKRSLKKDGVFFLDAFGGYEACKEITEERECDGFTYIWEQASFNPINSHMQCYIHFVTDEGIRMDRAFDYYWRLWTLPEITEMLLAAGFSSAQVYWEQEDKKSGEGNGEYIRAEQGTADAGWVCYIVAES